MEMDGNINPRRVLFFGHLAFIPPLRPRFSPHPLTFICEPFAVTARAARELRAGGQEQIETAE